MVVDARPLASLLVLMVDQALAVAALVALQDQADREASAAGVVAAVLPAAAVLAAVVVGGPG